MHSNPHTPILKSLHWLKVNKRIEYKLLSLTYKVLTTSQPSYLNNLISVQPPHCICSSSLVTLSCPPTISSLKVTDRLFTYASLRLWNNSQIHSVSQSCRLTSSFTCQLISVIITTLIIHLSYTFTPGLKPAFSTNPSHFNTSTLDCRSLHDLDGTYRASRFIFSSLFSLIFLFVLCGGLSWLHVSFLLHVKYTIWCRTIVKK